MVTNLKYLFKYNKIIFCYIWSNTKAMYELYDSEGKKIEHHNLQDKSHWCKDGEKVEEAFIRIYGSRLNLIINPDKETNPYAPDLLNITSGQLGDLKHQGTPFFKAQSLYNIDPTFAVVFNEKDQKRYEEKYSNIKIYYWINWLAIKFKMSHTEIMVHPLNGVWATEFNAFNQYLKICPLHNYQQRKDDNKGNAKGSYVCDIRDNVFKRLI
ncbi:hypothetical protein OZ668_09125 [Elizabethkingia sp. HX XZB]|uniref:hypothetical protein n=1 Tax=Elizabethkingia sp. HX XZB TaxID=3003193 RepID=UPI002A24DCC5|nr:hypothetical protein [Elizabethkingia sp. HX XZB]MDX8568146.1 hypothetical protein [Elizabethkingia sp. HX XZB]